MERDAIFGLLAVQLGFATAAQIMESSPRDKDEQRTLPERLQAKGMLTPDRRQMLEKVVDEALAAHGGDSRGALDTLGGGEAIYAIFGGLPNGLAATAPTLPASLEGPSTTLVDLDAVTGEAKGRYVFRGGRETAEIGRGGIGRVLVAHDGHLGREIAVKELLNPGGGVSELASDLDPTTATTAQVARFLREARVTGQLEHPNIVPVYEVGSRKDGTLYYTMKLVRGKTFDEALEDCDSLKDRLRLLPHYVDLCQALAYAHSRGVIHRDIKPHNVMVGEFGETVVLDWGLAKVKGKADIRGEELEHEIELFRDAAAGKTMYGTAVGTPAYMSPEQAEGRIDEINEQSDVWSLGTVLFEILTGRPPFPGEHPYEVLDKVMNAEVERPETLDEAIPADLSSVCLKAVTRDRWMRYRSALELADEIEAYQAGRRVGAYEYSSMELLKRLLLQNKATSAVVALLVVCLVVGAGVIFSAYRTAETNRVKAEHERQNAETSRANEEEARILAEKKERQAHLNLSIAYQEEAGRLLEEKDFMGAGIFAAAALVNNPHNTLSPYRYPDDEQHETDESLLQLATLHSQMFAAAVNRNVSLKGVVPGAGELVMDLVWHPDGTLLATAGFDGKVGLVSANERRVVDRLTGHDGRVTSVAFSPGDGKHLAFAGKDGTLRLWDVRSRKPAMEPISHGAMLRSIAFSPDGAFVAAGAEDGKVMVWGVPGRKMVAALEGHQGPLRRVAFSPDGRLVASAGEDKTVRLWKVDGWQPQAVLEGHEEIVFAAAFSHDSSLLASGSFDGTVRLWDVAGGKLLATLEGHRGHVISVSFSPDGRLLASGGHDRRIVLWSVPERRLVTSFVAHDSWVRAVRFSPVGGVLASGGADGHVRLWDLHEGKVVDAMPGHDASIFRIAFSPDGRLLASASLDASIRLWDTVARETVAEFAGHERFVWGMDFSPDGTLLASAGTDGKVRLWSVTGRKSVGVLDADKEWIGGVAFSPDGAFLVSGGSRDVTLWNVAEKREVRRFGAGLRRAYSVAFSPDGALVATGDEGHVVKLWSIQDGSAVHELVGHEALVSGLSFTGDGKKLATSSKDGTIKVWDVQEGTLLKTLTGHTEWVNLAEFSPDGTLILSGGDDNSVRIWDAATGRVLYVRELSGEVTGVGFAPNGRRFAVAEGSEVHVLPVLFDSWVKDPARMQEKAQQDAGMSLYGFTLRGIVP